MKVKCLVCKKVLESFGFYHHDFVQCNCPNETFVDQVTGTKQYRFGGKDMKKVEVVTE